MLYADALRAAVAPPSGACSARGCLAQHGAWPCSFPFWLEQATPTLPPLWASASPFLGWRLWPPRSSNPATFSGACAHARALPVPPFLCASDSVSVPRSDFTAGWTSSPPSRCSWAYLPSQSESWVRQLGGGDRHMPTGQHCGTPTLRAQGSRGGTGPCWSSATLPLQQRVSSSTRAQSRPHRQAAALCRALGAECLAKGCQV